MTSKNNMNLYLLVYLKRYKLDSENKSPLFLRVSFNGKRVEIALRRSISPDLWDNKRQCVKGRSPEAQSINEQIRVSKRRIHDCYVDFLNKNEFISAEKLKNAFLGISKEGKSLVYAFEYHNTLMKAQIGKEYAKGTYERFLTCLNILKEFITNKYQKTDILLRELDLSFILDFDYYLRTKRDCCNNTTIKYVRNLKKIINQAKALEWIEHDPFLNYKAKLDIVDREVLTQSEINRLLDKDFGIQRLNQIKDIFLFCCFTGLAYADIKKLSKENIFIGIDGHNWILINRTKTNVQSKIPVLPIAQEILDKYKSHPECIKNNTVLPVPSNQKYNGYLKEIADCSGITKNLTSHIARHTFATTITLNNRVPIESVARMLGHRSIKTTEHYSKVLDVKISDDMSNLMNNYNNKLKLVNE
jgi:site-specific recombinase XerD